MDPNSITIRIDKSKNPIFERVQKEIVELVDKRIIDPKGPSVFLLAAAIGFNEGAKYPIQGETIDKSRASFMSSDGEYLLQAIYFSEKDIEKDVIDLRQAVRLAEQYANAGLDSLDRMMASPMSFREELVMLVNDNIADD